MKIYIIESLFYELAVTTTSTKSRKIIFDKIKERTEMSKKSLLVLEHGGVLTRIIDLNVVGHKNVKRSISYKSNIDKTFSLEIIDLNPKFIQVIAMTKMAEKLLLKRTLSKKDKDYKTFFKIAKKLRRFYKVTPTFFHRMSENIRRTLYEGELKLQELRTLVENKKTLYKQIRAGITVGILFLVLILGSWIIQSIHRENRELRKAKNEANEANKAKSEFLANMSHEIRTPLNAILGFVGILLEKEKDDESKEYLRVIDSSSHTLLATIGNILDFSKLETGKLETEMIDFNAREEFENVVFLFDAKASEKDILLTLHVDENVPKFLKTDLHKIKQITSNLISNALKFSERKNKIEIILEYKEDFLTVSVKDEGKGINKDKLEHIFEAFGQEDSSTTRKHGGTGLGLSISASLSKLLGGALHVESTLGVGSRFFFKIPVQIGQEKKSKKERNKDKKLKENINLLLVEDNKSNQMFMKVILKKENIEPDIANDGIEAINLFKSNSYDIILMDENMPNMNGIEATKKILEYEKNNNFIHTPIIALTANALKGDRERFLEAGMDEYMTKPVDREKLEDILFEFLEDEKGK